jgi:hypothetical protein
MADFANNGTMAVDANAKPIPVMKPVSTEKLALTTAAASAASRTFTTNVLRIVADVGCFYRLDGTATTSHAYLPVDTVEYIKCETGDTLSVILASGTGSMYISEMV